MLDNLKFTCVKCTQTHTYSAAANCTQKFCRTCAIYYNEQKPHYCFSCWRCKTLFNSVDLLKQHLNECNPDKDRNWNQDFTNSVSDVWSAIDKVNRKVHFVFDSLMTILESKGLTDGFQSLNYESKGDKLRKFKSEIGFKSSEADFERSEAIRELDLRVFYKGDTLELYDSLNCQYIGTLKDIIKKIERFGCSPATVIDKYIELKTKYGNQEIQGGDLELASWTSRMLQLVARALPDPAEPERRFEIKPYGKGTLEILDGYIKKTSYDGWNSLARLEKPLSEGVHNFKVRIDRTRNNQNLYIGIVDESYIDPSVESFANKAIGISVRGSSKNFGLNRHHKKWYAFNGDVIDIKIDFNRSTIEFYLNGSIFADADVKKYGYQTLKLAIYIFYQEDAVTLLEYN